MKNFFLLSDDQVFGPDKLSFFERGYIKGVTTDYENDKNSRSYLLKDDQDNHYCDWWLQKKDSRIFGSIVNSKNDTKLSVRCNLDGNGIRPAVKYDNIRDFINNFTILTDGVMEFEFEEYPKTRISMKDQVVLDTLFLRGELETDSNGVCEYNDCKAAKPGLGKSWCKIEPIKWLLDPHSGIAVSKMVLDGGKMSYDKAVKFLEEEFPSKAIDEDTLARLNIKARLAYLKEQRSLIDDEMMKLNNDIMVLMRKKKN